MCFLKRHWNRSTTLGDTTNNFNIASTSYKILKELFLKPNQINCIYVNLSFLFYMPTHNNVPFGPHTVQFTLERAGLKLTRRC